MKTKPLTQKLDRKEFTTFGRKCLSLTSACMILAGIGTSSALRAGDEKGSNALSLETNYFGQRIGAADMDTVKTVLLEVKLDGKGGATGTLTLDPNRPRRGRGALRTFIAETYVKVTLKEIKADDSANKGRQLYEISGKGLDRLLLLVPRNEDGPCWLLVGGKEGIEDMIEMRRK